MSKVRADGLGVIVMFVVCGTFAFGVPARSAEPGAGLPDGLKLVAPTIPDDIRDTWRTLNAQLSRDLAPADNAAVLLIQTLGEQSFDPVLKEPSLRLMGIAEFSATAPRLLTVEDFQRANGAGNELAVITASRQLQENVIDGSERLWTAEEFPDLDAYLKANSGAFSIIEAASRKPRLFVPMLSSEMPPRLLSASLSIERRVPYLARLLCARALGALARGDVEGCRRDLATAHRLTLLLATGSPFDVSNAKAAIMDALIYQATLAAIESGELDAAQAQAMLKELREIPRLPSPSRAADVGERAILHQEIDLLKTDEESVKGFFEVVETADGKPWMPQRLKDLDWKLAHQTADQIQDGVVKALGVRDRMRQIAMFRELDAKYAQWEETADENSRRIAERLDQDLPAASRWIGESVAMSLRPWYWQRRMGEDRQYARRDLLEIALILTIYRQQFQKYPESLAELAKVDATPIPADPHTDQPFAYVRLPNGGARLNSWGPNGRDDAGERYNDDMQIDLP